MISCPISEACDGHRRDGSWRSRRLRVRRSDFSGVGRWTLSVGRSAHDAAGTPDLRARARHRRVARRQAASDSSGAHRLRKIDAGAADVARSRPARRRRSRDPATAPARGAPARQSRGVGARRPARRRSRIPDSLRKSHVKKDAHPLRDRGNSAAATAPGSGVARRLRDSFR